MKKKILEIKIFQISKKKIVRILNQPIITVSPTIKKQN